ncbi:MAG: DMT family transporter [Rhodobacteraceae bacterium]|nr:DMT family transporter [Paracoccaceae bacterium]
MDVLLLGLLAALFWGLHDFILRIFGARADTLVLFAGVLLTGVLVLLPLAALNSSITLNSTSLGFALLAGLTYAAAGYGLYRAFTIGPVYLVAPICGASPIVTVALELTRGGTVALAAWISAAVILGGIALIARSENNGNASGSRASAIGWAVISCLGFAFTLALSQWASEGGAPLQVSLTSRVMASFVILGLVALKRPDLGPTLQLWPTILLLGVLDVAAITTVTLTGGMTNAEYASVSASTFGVITILLASRFLGERLGPVQWLGCALVFAGIATLGLSNHAAHG